jgi:hypothetical protein
MNGTTDEMDTKAERRRAIDPPVGRACLVDGCACKDARIISTRRVAFFAQWARQHRETADRRVAPDAMSRELIRPYRDRWTYDPEEDGQAARRTGPSYTSRPGW